MATPFSQDPYMQNVAAYNQAQTDRCVRIVCGITIGIFLLMILIWLISALFSPRQPVLVHRRTYVVPPGRPIPPPGYYHLVKEWMS